MNLFKYLLVFVFVSCFFLKDIIPLLQTNEDAVCFMLDEDETSGEDEKGGKDETDSKEEWKISTDQQLILTNTISNITFHSYHEKQFYTPYFEITSPPPEMS